LGLGTVKATNGDLKLSGRFIQLNCIYVGEILTALSFFYRCDECQESDNGNVDYTKFSVPLVKRIVAPSVENSSSGSAGKRKLDPPDIRVNFIQICRDYMRSPWSGVADQVFLQNMSRAGRYAPNLQRVKMLLFSVGSQVHTRSGFKKVFARYWDSLCLRLSDRLNSHVSACCDEAIMAFLVSKNLRRTHKHFIMGK
jgi:hypothetical protein